MFIKTSIFLVTLFCLPFWVATVFATPEYQEEFPVAVVLGAGVQVNGEPTTVLQNRLDTASEMYSDGALTTIVVSGDNREANYNEPEAMRQYLINQGVQDADIVLDYGGRRTADTCWRVKHVFNAEEVTLISQRFHLSRAALLCESMGLDVGLASAENSFQSQTAYNIFREIPATWTAMIDILLGYEAEVGSSGQENDLSAIQ